MSKKYNHKFDDIPVSDSRDPERLREPVEALEVTLTYSKGSEGWRPAPRGWTLHVQPVSYLRPEPGVIIRRYSPTDGVRRFVHEVQRVSMKGQGVAIAKAEEVMDETVRYCLDRNPHLTVVTENSEEVISLPVQRRMSETEALMKNYNDYQRRLPQWARGPG